MTDPYARLRVGAIVGPGHPKNRRRVTGDVRARVVRICCDGGVLVPVLFGRSQQEVVMNARRQVVSYLKSLGWSSSQVGRLLGRSRVAIYGLIKRTVRSR